MTVFKQALANAKLAILILLIALFLSMTLNFFMGYCLYRVPSQQTIYVPPHVPDSGLTVKAGETSPAEVYAFTYYIWQSLQTWPVNGEKDYTNNINELSPYITPSFKNTLVNEGKQLLDQGFLYGHQQIVSGTDGSAFNPVDVKYMGHGTWMVHLTMRTINRVSPAHGGKSFETSHVVRDAQTSFVFKVVQYDYAPDKNHWHLAIAAYGAKPKVSKIFK